MTKTERTKKCKLCGEKFSTNIAGQVYCSFDCAKEAQRLKRNQRARNKSASRSNLYRDIKTPQLLICKVCGKEYTRYPSSMRHRGSSYCSVKCSASGRRKSRPKSKLIKDLDAVYSRYIRYKYSVDGWVSCVTCGKSRPVKEMQNGHYVSRRFHSTRWDDQNCHPQCYSCNVGLGGNYAMYTKFMLDKYGSGIIDTLISRSHSEPNYSVEYLMSEIARYKAIVHEYEQLLTD